MCVYIITRERERDVACFFFAGNRANKSGTCRELPSALVGFNYSQRARTYRLGNSDITIRSGHTENIADRRRWPPYCHLSAHSDDVPPIYSNDKVKWTFLRHPNGYLRTWSLPLCSVSFPSHKISCVFFPHQRVCLRFLHRVPTTYFASVIFFPLDGVNEFRIPG